MTPFTQVSEQIPARIDEFLNMREASTSRRDFLKTSGMLVVSFSAAAVAGPFAGEASAQVASAQNAAAPSAGARAAGLYPDPDFRQLDAWIVIHQDNTAIFSVGKTDCGQGTGTAFRQMMSDELDIAYDHTTCIMGRTDVTVDQGGSGGSTALQVDAWPMRRVAAEARRVLLDLASARFGVPVAELAVSNSVVTVKADPSKKVTYGELIGDKRFNVALTGANVGATTGVAKVKPVQDLKIVGLSPQRYDIPPKVDGSLKWAVDVKLPGMVHARNVKPPVAGATVGGIDESSVNALPGFVKVVSKGNYVAVVFEREEQAIAAARKLKVNWQKPATPPFPTSEGLFDYMRSATPTSVQGPEIVGNPRAAFASAAKVVEAEYDIPFQGHTAFSPAHATADPSNGQMTIYSNDMKSYGMRNGIAAFLGMPREQVRVVWMEGPQGYGRTAADDAGFEAAYIAKEIGRPVRMQWMRQEETAWDTKGPAFAVTMRGALDADGNLIALDYNARSADYGHLGYNEPDTVLIAQLMGSRRATPAAGSAATPSNMYVIPHTRTATQVVSMPIVWESPIRTGNLRDPNGPQSTFAAESFIDEMAVAAKVDAVAFRLKLLTASTSDDSGFKRARSIAAIKAAAEKFGWDTRPSPMPTRKGDIFTGRGIAYAFRGQTVVAVIAEVEVNRRTGHVWVKRMVCGYDCGLVVNPEALRHSAEGGLLYSLSRAIHEEVAFDTEKVTSMDWISHPSLTHLDTPEKIDIVLVNGDPNPNRPDLPPYGAGETSCKPTIAAVANAIHDATGVRLRRVPFRDARVLAALNAAGVRNATVRRQERNSEMSRLHTKPIAMAVLFLAVLLAASASQGQQTILQQEVALIQQASKYFQAKDYANAIQTYNAVIKLNPKMAAPYGGLGDVYMAQGQYQMAVTAYKQYFVLGVPDPQTYFNLGDADFDLSQYDQAIATYQSAMVNLPPNSNLATGQLYKRIGDAYAFNKKYPDAIAALQKSLQFYSPNDSATYDLGIAYAAAGQKTEAMQIYQQLQSSNKSLAQQFYKQITSGGAPKLTPTQPGAAQPNSAPPNNAPPKQTTNKNSL